MNKNALLNRLAGTVVLLVMVFGVVTAVSAAVLGAPKWDYSDPAGWASLGDGQVYATCGNGQSQSPIDIKEAVKSDIAIPSRSYKDTPLSITNNGHTIQVNYDPSKGSITIDGLKYELHQFHFHTQSEHTLDGKRMPVEVHFVHKTQDGTKAAVIGVFLKVGEENKALADILKHAPAHLGPLEEIVTYDVPGKLINALGLQPKELKKMFHYSGSLTTPPCTEGIQWFVAKKMLTASQQQIDALRKLMVHNGFDNYRPVQELNGRPIHKIQR